MIRKLSFIIAFTTVAASVVTLVAFKSLPSGGLIPDKQQEQRAFVLLNKVRQNPNSYSGRFGFSLKGIAPRPNLNWDDSLCAVAERKAISMATRAYFGPVDPDGYGINYYINKASYFLPDDMLKHKKESNYEAIEGGAPSGEIAISNIIVDKAGLGDEGRKLLLGIGDFNGALVDVGIGYVHSVSTQYKSYTCVIIAKRTRPGPSQPSIGN